MSGVIVGSVCLCCVFVLEPARVLSRAMQKGELRWHQLPAWQAPSRIGTRTGVFIPHARAGTIVMLSPQTYVQLPQS